ncbi:MAG TPA: hypothetical protein VLB90_07290 [Pseudomonadales bacterium]|nr:hypothetical protein [Pseudomonadales bacterium]
MHSPLAAITMFISYYAAYLLWLAFIHQNRGNKLSKETSKNSGITFSTNQGDFFIDQVKQSFKYKPKGEATWKAISFDAINGISSVYGQDDASWYEFFLSDWELWDLSGQYRDVTNINTVELHVAGGSRIPLVEIRQYEQRELWLGQWSYELHISLLKTLGLYHPLDDVTEMWTAAMTEKCGRSGLRLARV